MVAAVVAASADAAAAAAINFFLLIRFGLSCGCNGVVGMADCMGGGIGNDAG